MTAYFGSTYGYDAENRLNYANVSSSYGYYGYDSQNKRVFVWNGGTDPNGNPNNYTVAFYGLNGQRLARYTVAVNQPSQYQAPTLGATLAGTDAYFGSRRLVAQDRLGSANGKYYPYGEDRSANGGMISGSSRRIGGMRLRGWIMRIRGIM